MIERTVRVIPVNKFQAVASMTVNDILDVAVPARAFMPKARLNPIEQRVVERLRHLHALIQRDFTGEKKRNAQGPLADYLRDEWLPEPNGKPPAGFMPAFIIYFPDELKIDDEGHACIKSKGVFLDGESRGDSLLVNVERMGDTEVDQLLSKPVAVHIVHNIQDPQVIAKYFADVNGKGVGVNPNLVVMRDYTDPYAEITKRVFDRLGIELETRQRQVRASSDAVITGLQARLMVAAIVKGVGAVQYGAKPIPKEDVDFQRLETVAEAWLKRVFTTFGPEAFKDKSTVVRAVPVTAVLGALGKPFYEGTAVEEKVALEVLSDKKIDWSSGAHWSGVCGKVNPSTGNFTLGGGKEYAYATWRALTDKSVNEWKKIRHLEKPSAAAS